MVDLGVDMDRLRADYRLVRDWCVECGEWTEDEADEIGLHIRAVADQPDLAELAFWAEWFERFAEMAQCHQAEMQRLDQEARDWVAEQRRAAA